jgi:hypothetical protein
MEASFHKKWREFLLYVQYVSRVMLNFQRSERFLCYSNPEPLCIQYINQQSALSKVQEDKNHKTRFTFRQQNAILREFNNNKGTAHSTSITRHEGPEGE